MYIVEQVGVVDEHQMCVEDPRLGLPDVAGRRRSYTLDLTTYDGNRLMYPSPLCGSVGRHLIGDVHIGGMQGQSSSDRDSRRRGKWLVRAHHASDRLSRRLRLTCRRLLL